MSNKTLKELTTTTETAAWIPTDTYAQGVFMALHTKRTLGRLAAARRVDIQKGRGDTIQFKKFNPRTPQGPIAEGGALTKNASGMTTVSVTIEKFGDADSLTDESITQTDGDVKGLLLAEMGAALEEELEQKVMDVLTGAAGTKSHVLAAKGIIDYTEVLEAAALLKGDKYAPDTLVISADHEVDLLLDANLTKTVDYGPGEVSLPGEIGRIGRVRVIVHDLAPAKDTTTVNAVQGVMFDSRRAFAEAFGKKLRFHERYLPLTDEYEQVAWVWYGAAVIDADSIVLMKNAAA